MSQSSKHDTTGEARGEEFVHLDPDTLVVGANVRVDTRPDAKQFAASIKNRGVLEVITAYRDGDGQVVVLRGQRRTVVAAHVGTPTGTVPVRVVPAPADPDRINDQLVENLHRADMHEREVRDGIEQLSLAGVSPAQIAKRTATPRATVNAALTVTRSRTGRDRMDADDDLTLDQAAILAEFEDDDAATDRLVQALRFRRPLDHLAQRLRDEAADAARLAGEVEQWRGEGLPVLDAEQADAVENLHRCRMEDLRTADGEPVPAAQWAAVPGAAVVLEEQWQPARAAQDPAADDNTDGDEVGDVDATDGEEDEVCVWVPVWVCTDPAAAGLHHHLTRPASAAASGADGSADSDDTSREAQREQRRLVIANNKAWASAETVRREWLAGLVVRKAAPKGAEALICEAIVTGQHTLSKAMERRHHGLCDLLGLQPGEYYGASEDLSRMLAKATTPKSATMLALACVLAGWEVSTGKHTWRNPSGWDARVLGALTEWGYRPSEVERLLLARADDAPDDTDDGEDSADAA